MIFRPYQNAGGEAIRGFLWSAPSRQVVSMATGTGKSLLIAFSAQLARTRFGGNGRTLILSHRNELVHQVARQVEAQAPYLKVGIEMSQHRAPRDSSVVVASVQTLAQSRDRLDWFVPDLVAIDEGHHAPASSYVASVARLCGPRTRHVLGFTATPYRAKGTPLFGAEASFYDGVLYEYDLKTAIQDGWLVDLRGYRVTSEVDLDFVRITRGDFSPGELAEAVDVEPRTALGFKGWKEVAEGRRTIAFCAGISHAENAAEFFRSQGVRAQALSIRTPARERAAILEAYHAGEVQVLTNAALLTEGYDAPETDCILMLRPTRAWNAYVQMIGRGTRLAEEKTDCVVIDVVDATRRHDICTLPGLAGLPAKANLQGATFTEALGLPGVPKELREFEGTVEELRAKVEEVNLLDVGRRRPARGEDLTGQRFGEWLVIGRAGRGSDQGWRWLCRCDCGSESEIAPAQLRGGHSKACRSCAGASRRLDLTGQRFGKLVAVARSEQKGKVRAWLCRCDCGGEKVATAGELRGGSHRSCGCAFKNARLFRGQWLSLKEIAALTGISFEALRSRLKKGMSLEEAVSKPVRRRSK